MFLFLDKKNDEEIIASGSLENFSYCSALIPYSTRRMLRSESTCGYKLLLQKLNMVEDKAERERCRKILKRIARLYGKAFNYEKAI